MPWRRSPWCRGVGPLECFPSFRGKGSGTVSNSFSGMSCTMLDKKQLTPLSFSFIASSTLRSRAVCLCIYSTTPPTRRRLMCAIPGTVPGLNTPPALYGPLIGETQCWNVAKLDVSSRPSVGGGRAPSTDGGLGGSGSPQILRDYCNDQENPRRRRT